LMALFSVSVHFEREKFELEHIDVAEIQQD
jgi:hypothetical protein